MSHHAESLYDESRVALRAFVPDRTEVDTGLLRKVGRDFHMYGQMHLALQRTCEAANRRIY
jgi:hypothetical protein